jgi:hypothetical protein
MRRLKWAGLAFALGFIVMLDPSYSPGQFGKGGKGGFGKGGGGEFGGFGKKGGGDFGKRGGGEPTLYGGGAGGAPAFGQPPGGGGFGGGRDGGGGGQFRMGGGGGFGGPRDPEQMFSGLQRMTGSTGDTLDLSKFDQRFRDSARQRAERDGSIPLPESGIMTRAEFLDHFARSEAARAAKAASNPGPGGPGGGFTMTIGPDGRMEGRGSMGGFGGGPPMGSGGDRDRDRGGERLREQDKDGDGKVSRAEADNRLQPNFERIDTDRDGFITLDEYRGYYAAQNNGGGRDQNNQGNSGYYGGNGDFGGYGRRDERREIEEAKLPGPIRYTTLPKDLPEWYKELDGNQDAQVALHEWRTAGKDLNEFFSYDLNSDGLVTVDELVRFQILKTEADKIAALTGDGTMPRPSFGGGSRGGGGITLPGSTSVSSEKTGGGSEKGFGYNKGKDRGSEKSSDNGSDKGSERPNPFRKSKGKN